MKKNVWFFKGILGIMLVFILVLAGCDNPTQIDGDVSINAIGAPAVEAEAVTAGVELSWLPVVGVEGYEIWRRSAEEPDRLLGDRENTEVGEDGKIYVIDTVGLNNPLKSETSYTYTIYAKAASSAKNDSKAEVSVTTGVLPAEGTVLSKPANVTLSLDLERNQISVSWDKGDPSLGYWVDIYRDTTPISYTGSSGEWTAEGSWGSDVWSSESGWVTWKNSLSIRRWGSLQEGTYTAKVTAIPWDEYFKESPIAVSSAIAYTPLFSNNPSVSPSLQAILGTGEEASILKGFTATIYLSGIAKPDVTYSLERVKLDAAGNEEATYTSVTLSKASATATAVADGDLKADPLGNLPLTTVYDRTLPATAGTYRYRVKAVKAGIDAPEYKKFEVTVNPYDFITSLSVSIGTKTAEGSNVKYAVTPSVSPKGVLQDGDKLVIYAVKGTVGSYQYGPYVKAFEFTKTELEAATVTPKNIVLANDGDAAFVQAYFESADGAKMSLSQYLNGTGVDTTDFYTPSGGGSPIYYAKLYYK